MDNDFPDYAQLISQYEATEYDMLDALSKSDNGSAHMAFKRRRNAPGGSDSESDHSGDIQSQTSYELDNTEVDDDDDGQKEQESKSGDNYSQTSYEPDNTEASDDSNELKISLKTEHRNSDKIDLRGEGSDSYSVDSDEVQGEESESSSKDSEYNSFASASGTSDSDSDDDNASGKHSDELDESTKNSIESNDESESSYLEDIDGEENPCSGSNVSFPYETDDSNDDLEALNPNSFVKTIELDASDIESDRDKSAMSRSTNSLDSDKVGGSSNTNGREDNRDYSLESHEIRAQSHFNRRGMSNHSFKHPSVDSGTLSDSSDGSGWQDGDDSSSQESQANGSHESFEDEPKSKSFSSKQSSSVVSESDRDESDDDSSAEDSEEGFEDEIQSNQERNKDKQIFNPFDSDDSSNDDDDSGSGSEDSGSGSGSEYSGNGSGSEYSDGSESEYSVEGSEYSDGDDENEDAISENFNDETTRSMSKKNGHAGRQTSLSSTLVSSVGLEEREKLVVDRESSVNTRERKFTKWFIAISVLVLLGAIILLIVYFASPGKPADTPAPISAPTAVPVAVPEPTSTAPTMRPSIPFGQTQIIDETPEPAPMPPKKVVVETSFLASVPNGKINGVTAKALEDDLSNTFEILFPQVLTEVLQSDAMATSTRRYLRTLQKSDKDNIVISNPIGVDVVEVDCPVGEPESSLCVKVTTNIPIDISSNIFSQEYVSQLKTAYSSAITNAIDDGGVQEIDPDVIIVAYDDRTEAQDVEPTEAPIGSTSAPTLRPTMQKLTFSPTLNATEVASESGTSSSSLFSTTNSSDPDSEVAATATSSPSEVPSEKITSSPSMPSASVSPTMQDLNETTSPTASPDNLACKDESDECFESLESGECLMTKCEQWQSTDECDLNPLYMKFYCKKTCDLCGDSENFEDADQMLFPTESPTEGGPCVDTNTMCGEWAMQNECNSNPGYMEVHCRDACGFCGCEDKNDECSEISLESSDCLVTKCDLWASQGECNTNMNYMDIFCRKTCDRCGDKATDSCKDGDDRCVGWANDGECTTNPSYMELNCAKACDICI
mmetsp:Transcript_12114/g.28737  ORF Transcript_12114/g.28737 Transcript_12114/m.28737 type:complete len:1065 (-) Transcript_12114:262-3456(-)